MPRSESSASNCCLVDEVAADLVLEVRRPVELDGALDVALVVGRGVLVDLDEDDLGVVEVFLDPLGGDERGLAAHCGSFSLLFGGRGRVSDGRCGSAPTPLDQQVQLAAEAEAEDRVEQGGDQGEPGRDLAEQGRRRPRRRRRATSANDEADAPARTAAAPGPRARPAAPSRGRTTVRNSHACGVCCTPGRGADREQHGLDAGSAAADGLGSSRTATSTTAVIAGGELRAAGVDAGARRRVERVRWWSWLSSVVGAGGRQRPGARRHR